jgi:hypothetical protein
MFPTTTSPWFRRHQFRGGRPRAAFVQTRPPASPERPDRIDGIGANVRCACFPNSHDSVANEFVERAAEAENAFDHGGEIFI